MAALQNGDRQTMEEALEAKVDSINSSSKSSVLEKSLSENINNESTKKRKSASPAIPNKEQKKSKAEKEDSVEANSEDFSGSSNQYPLEEVEEESYEDIAKQYKRFSNAPKFNLNSEEVFCICRKPDYGGQLMISCDGCDEWFHFKCMKLNEEHSKLIAKFYCKFCRWKGINSTKWKRKCRLNRCWEPVRADAKSKYCCDEHGILFIKQNILDRNGITDLKSDEIKSIFNYCTSSNNGYENLMQLGSKFPELPEIISFNEGGTNISNFPEDVKQNLLRITSKLDNINSLISSCKLKSDYLLKVKEKIKIINEKLGASYEEDEEKENEEKPKSSTTSKKGKNKKSKKFDLCCYDKSLNHGIQMDDETKSSFEGIVNSADIYANCKEQIDRIVNFYHDHRDDIDSNVWFDDEICILDKRKCLRHNGWWNLINDELSKKFNELSSSAKKLEDEKLLILRKYSITIYELRC